MPKNDSNFYINFCLIKILDFIEKHLANDKFLNLLLIKKCSTLLSKKVYDNGRKAQNDKQLC